MSTKNRARIGLEILQRMREHPDSRVEYMVAVSYIRKVAWDSTQTGAARIAQVINILNALDDAIEAGEQ